MTDRDPHLVVTCPKVFPDDILSVFGAEVAHAHLRLKVIRTPEMETKAAIEWLVPTAVIAYLAKPYFEEFLKEAGKDHYALLKTAIKKLWRWFFHPTEKLRTYKVGRLGIAPADPLYSRTFSVVVEVNAPLTIKLLIRESASESAFSAIIDKFIDELERLHGGDRDAPLRALIAQARPVASQILLTYDDSVAGFILIDPIPLLPAQPARPTPPIPKPTSSRSR